MACIFIHFTSSFTEQKISILVKSTLSLLPFMDHVFGVLSQKSLPNPRSSRFSPQLPSGSFIVLHFTFTFLIHFELIFVEKPSLSGLILLHVGV